MKPIPRCPAAMQNEFTRRRRGRSLWGWFPGRFTPPRSDLRRKGSGSESSTSSASPFLVLDRPARRIARVFLVLGSVCSFGFPAVAQMPHGFAHAHGQFCDDLEPLQCLWRQVQFPAAHFQQQKLRVSEDSRQRIVQFVAENLAEVAVVQPQLAQRKAAAAGAVIYCQVCNYRKRTFKRCVPIWNAPGLLRNEHYASESGPLFPAALLER